MRAYMVSAIAALLALSPGTARAQADIGAVAPPGSLDLGVRFTDVNGDAARFQRFRDISDGALLDRVRWHREASTWFLKVGLDHAGRDDQRYWGEYGGSTRLKVRFQWDQIPLFISQDTRTLYAVQSPGVLRLNNSLRQGIETGQFRLADVVDRASPFDVRSRRDVAQFALVYSATRDVDLKMNVKTTRRNGTMPWGASFGFSNDVEVPAPIDTRTTDVGAVAEWANVRGSVRVGYDGSWFNNHVETLVWDNPLKITDSTFAGAYSPGTAGSQGRAALWPSSTMHGVNTAASVKLPASTRATANVTVGTWNQNQPLVPFTINTAIAAPPLPRATAEGSARTLAMNYTVSSRPVPYTWLTARYRYYDFNNRTPHFDATTGMVVFDQVLRAAGGSVSEPLSSTRQNVDLDASFTPVPFTALRIGYGREMVDRTFRIFQRTTDDVVRASIDSTVRWITVRGIVEHASRTGSGFDEELLAELGEQPAIRHFDIADRDRNRVTALLQINPLPAVGLSAAAAAGKDDYAHSGFGLRSNENRSYTFTADLIPRTEIAAALSYTVERYTALQNSRTASPGPQFVDATRNWSIDSADRARTFAGNLDLVKLIPKTELRLAYNRSRSTAAYVYGVPSVSTIAAPVQLPTVMNELQTVSIDTRYFLTDKLAAAVGYWNDRYRVNDFALGPDTISRLDMPGSLFLGYLYRPYTANSGSVRLIYFW